MREVLAADSWSSDLPLTSLFDSSLPSAALVVLPFAPLTLARASVVLADEPAAVRLTAPSASTLRSTFAETVSSMTASARARPMATVAPLVSA